jgi:hypothetical protein
MNRVRSGLALPSGNSVALGWLGSDRRLSESRPKLDADDLVFVRPPMGKPDEAPKLRKLSYATAGSDQQSLATLRPSEDHFASRPSGAYR